MSDSQKRHGSITAKVMDDGKICVAVRKTNNDSLLSMMFAVLAATQETLHMPREDFIRFVHHTFMSGVSKTLYSQQQFID